MKTWSLWTFVALVLLSVGADAIAAESPPADPIRFMRDPHVAGELMAFSYQGDIWLANRDGTQPRKLTNHLARDVAPRFSPDGRWIAFSSNRFGNYDVFLMPVEGGEPTQLTFHSANDMVEGWTPEGLITFTTSRGANSFLTPIYTVSPDGGLPLPLEMDQAANVAFSPDGRYLAYNRIGVNTTRKGYKGNRSPDVWLMDRQTGSINQLTDTDLRDFREHVADGVPMWGADGMIYFLSERDGTFNIWKMSPSGDDPVQVTRHTTGGVKYPSMSPDGRTIIYTNDQEIYELEVPGGSPRKVPVSLAFDPSLNRVEWVDVSNQAEGFSADPEGESVAVDSRGEIFLVPSDPEMGEMRQLTASAWRDRYEKMSPDGKLMAFVTDEADQGRREEIWVADLATGERRRLTDHDSYKDSDFVWSPDSRRIAFVAANRLFEVDVSTGQTTELAYNENRGFGLSEYSPDGRWLLYTRSDADENSDVYLFEVASRREVNVTQDPFRDMGGALTPDGSSVVFRSNRDGGTTHLFVASLTRLTEDPGDPLVKARKAEASEGSGARGGRSGEGEEDTESAGSQLQPLQVDPEGIRERARQLTSGENGPGDFFVSADGKTIYFTSRDDEGPGLFSIPTDGGDSRKVSAGSFSGLQPTKDRRTVFFTRRGSGGGGSEIYHMPLTGGSPRAERVDFAFRVKVDHRSEWEQIFDEAWRVMKYRFYDPDMHGKDWDAIREEYSVLLPHVGTYEDCYDLANQMIGELDASHVGVSGPSSVNMEREYQTRQLGLELEPAQGGLRVSHVYREGPADKEWLDVQVGDFVLALDGQEIGAQDNYWKILNHTLNEYVTVRVADSPAGANARDLRIQTVSSLRGIQYQEWVENNRDFVERESDGKIAYAHIQSMNQSSLEVFLNDIDRFWNAQGIIVDIRYNGGGNTDQQILDVLERRPYEYWNNRWAAPSSGRRPRQAIAGPKVMLINSRSASDSEVTPMGFRDLGLGSIVGTPTMGAVIATGSYRLLNGGSIRTPGSLVVTYDPTQPNNYGINLERYGVAPDVWAENTPEDELRGFDRELKAAVDEALRMLSEGRWQYQNR